MRKGDWSRTIWILALICAFILVAFNSCTKTIYVPTESVRVEYMDRLRVDSLVYHDSIFVSEKQKGDTIYLTEYRYKTEYKYQLVHDTISVLQTDSISYPVEVEVVKYRTRTIWKVLSLIGLMALGAVGFYLYRKLKP